MTDSEDILEESRETLDYLHENNSEKDSGGMPAAAYVSNIESSLNWKDFTIETTGKVDDELNEGDEFVRRSDVKAHIQDKKFELAGYAMSQEERDMVEKFGEELLEEL